MKTGADYLYKQLFSHPEIVRDLVLEFLAADWARHLTVEAFERVNASYASDHGQVRHEDVVWRARIGGDWVYVYILLEFQSRPDKWMAQLMLPAPAGLECFKPDLHYLLIDRHHEKKHSGIVGLLFQLLSAGTDVEMRLAIDAVAERVRERDMDAARDSLIRWLRLTLQDASLQTSMDLEEAFTMKMSRKFTYDEMFDPGMFERPIAKAREKALVEGQEQGRKEGLEEGLKEGERIALRRVVRSFLTEDRVTPEVAASISAANPEQLNGWIEALLKGVSPQQLFAGD